jgi:formylglycine-generating enzyme required for sulfatase activity
MQHSFEIDAYTKTNPQLNMKTALVSVYSFDSWKDLMKRKNWMVGLGSLGLLIVFLLNSTGAQSASKSAEIPSNEVPTGPLSHAVEPTQFAAVYPAAPIKAEIVKAAAPEVSSEPEMGSSRTWEVDGMLQVYVPGGEFLMGSTDPEAKLTVEGGRAYPEVPQNKVDLDGFWIDKFEVTNGQYAGCVAAGGCKPPFVNYSTGNPDYYGNPAFNNYPVIWVTWYKARAYCEWTGRRLPTEAEWEKAARGTQGAKYPWGNAPVSGDKANFCDKGCLHKFANPAFDDGYPDVAPVGSFPAGASPYGAMDMAGNVSEWTSTLVRPYPYVATDGREDLDAAGERVWRSSPWRNGFWWLRSSMRYRSVPTYQREVLGFRCASSN